MKRPSAPDMTHIQKCVRLEIGCFIFVAYPSETRFKRFARVQLTDSTFSVQIFGEPVYNLLVVLNHRLEISIL